MQDDNMIVLGDKVDLIGDKGRAYRTMIEDIAENVLYLVGVPNYRGVPMPLHENEEVFMVFYRDSGRFIARMRIAGFEKKGEIRYALLLLKEEPHRDQRRAAYRLPLRIKVLICEFAEPSEEESEEVVEEFAVEAPVVRAMAPPVSSAMEAPVGGNVLELLRKPAPAPPAAPEPAGPKTLEAVGSRDISTTGIALVTRHEYALGERFLLKLHLNDPREKTPFETPARVLRTSAGREHGGYYVGMQFFGQTRNMSELLSKYVFTQQQKQLKQKRLMGSG